jgi:uncharacterized protein YabE (DUF348 family)
MEGMATSFFAALLTFMNRFYYQKSRMRYGVVAAFFCLALLSAGVFTPVFAATERTSSASERLVTVHDGDSERTILTSASTLRQVFRDAKIRYDTTDLVEPGVDTPLTASHYEVNVYRARPITIIDGRTQVKVLSAYRTPKQIVTQAGMTLYSEDTTRLVASANTVAQGTGLQLSITRATPFSLVLYGKKSEARSQAKTVGEMLDQKGVTLGADDTLSVARSAPLTANMAVELWRNGKQTVTEEQPVAFSTQQIKDANQLVGYKQVKTPGVAGSRSVTYEIEMKNGVEVSRKEIQNVVLKQSEAQVEIVGIKGSGGVLTKSKGVNIHTDSQGTAHRETYYDLPMAVVARHCGSGGAYTVREDGAKVDANGYILIAANLAIYPRCSVVETSMGPGKVYDTGGFVAHHPHGFDIATDWTNNNGN